MIEKLSADPHFALELICKTAAESMSRSKASSLSIGEPDEAVSAGSGSSRAPKNPSDVFFEKAFKKQ